MAGLVPEQLYSDPFSHVHKSEINVAKKLSVMKQEDTNVHQAGRQGCITVELQVRLDIIVGRPRATIEERAEQQYLCVPPTPTAENLFGRPQSAIVTGNIATQRISIDEGAYFKGNIQKEAPKKEVPGVVSEEPRGLGFQQ